MLPELYQTLKIPKGVYQAIVKLGDLGCEVSDFFNSIRHSHFGILDSEKGHEFTIFIANLIKILPN